MTNRPYRIDWMQGLRHVPLVLPHHLADASSQRSAMASQRWRFYISAAQEEEQVRLAMLTDDPEAALASMRIEMATKMQTDAMYVHR